MSGRREQRTAAAWGGVVLVVCVWGVSVGGEARAGKVPEGYVPKVEQKAAQPPSAAWALERTQAAEVCTPAGERAFLTGLRCADGSPPTFKRVGSVGHRNDPPESMSEEARFAQMDPDRALPEGEVDVHIVDLYEVTCAGQPPVSVYLDMYHCPQVAYPYAPQGFGLAPAE